MKEVLPHLYTAMSWFRALLKVLDPLRCDMFWVICSYPNNPHPKILKYTHLPLYFPTMFIFIVLVTQQTLITGCTSIANRCRVLHTHKDPSTSRLMKSLGLRYYSLLRNMSRAVWNSSGLSM